MLLHLYALMLILLAVLPIVMIKSNLPLFHKLPTADKSRSDKQGRARVSVLIPARNEEASIEACLSSILKCQWADLEVLVMDDCSEDGTLAICEAIGQRDRRVKVLHGRQPPMGWNGKQRACWQLALAAQGDWLLFLDADVRLVSDAIPRLLRAAQSDEVDLLSGFPKQETGTVLEQLLIPLIHFILLGYLPIARMRASTSMGLAAGCGQLFLARRTAYMTCEGHKAICNSRHDGLMLPRAFRKQRFRTDIFDAKDLATCRMYHSAGQVLRGLLKNATEGIGHPKTILVFTVLLAGSAVLPVASLMHGLFWGWPTLVNLELMVAVGLSIVPRIMVNQRFGYHWLGALLHPLSVLMFLIIQWVALLGQLVGWRVAWRGRT